MRYFFDISSDRPEARDEVGCELRSGSHMQSEACRLLADIARDEGYFHGRAALIALVRDSKGRPVYRAILTLEGRSLA